MEKTNRQWLLAKHPNGPMEKSDFEWRESPVPEPGDGQALIRISYLSLDPTNRLWADNRESYMPPVSEGEVMRGAAIGVVEKSRTTKLPVGATVQGLLGWQDYIVDTGEFLTVFEPDPSIPLPEYFNTFGHIGLTAYFALLGIGDPQPGETLVVSAAAGAVGCLAGQIGKIKGCRVVGIAGSDDKCRWITDTLGFDAAINYKSGSVAEQLAEKCPEGIDIVFENVGGSILDASLSLINMKARIVLCGLIAQYNATDPVPGPYNFINILNQRARIEGFIIMDHFHRAGEAMGDLGAWYSEGRLKSRLDIVDGLENAVEAVNRLFDGSNKGKLLVKVSDG